MTRPHRSFAFQTLFLAVLALLALAPTVHAFTPVPMWSESWGGANGDIVNDIVRDGPGNLIVVGSFGGTVDFGGGPLVSAGGTDIFIAKYNAAGTHQWSKRIGGTGSDYAYSVTTDFYDNVIVVGRFSGTVDFGGGNLVAAGTANYFVAEYTSSGAYIWSNSHGGNQTDVAFGVAVTNLSDVVVTGTFQSTATLGDGLHFSVGGDDAFVEMYNVSGANIWTRVSGSVSDDTGRSVAGDAYGNITATGDFQGSVNFGSGNLGSAGGSDIYLARFTSGGVNTWTETFGSTGNDRGFAVAMVGTGAGDILLASAFSGTVNFGGGGLVSAGGLDIALASFSFTGIHEWSRRIGGPQDDVPLGISTDLTHHVLVTGYVQGTATYDGGSVTSAGSADALLARFDQTGAPVWVQHLGGTDFDQGRSIVPDLAGDAIIAGTFRGSADFGTGALTSAGSDDIFLATYTADYGEPTITSVTDIGNDQGRKVRIRFDRSLADAVGVTNPVTRYVAFRRDDPTPAASASRGASSSGSRVLANGWTQVGSVDAFNEATYGMDVPTVGDSTAALGQYYSVFYIRAATGTPAWFFDSLPDSGYSVDNLAPGVPQNFVYTAGSLSWDTSTADDFDYFTVYGANADDFGSASIVNYSVDPTLDVSASPYAYYYVTATDFSGNEGNPATVHALSGVTDTPRHYVLSLSNYPNPFNPRTTVSYTVPSRGHVTVSIFDASGAYVATLFDGERDAGAYRINWDGRTENAAVAASGVYFARIEHASGVRTRKMVLLK